MTEPRNDGPTTGGDHATDHGTTHDAYGSTPGASAGSTQETDRTMREEFRVSGEAVVAKVKELVREGNVRRITLKNDDGRVLLEIPLTIGVIGTVLLPVWAALGAMAALVANLTLAVERVEPRTPAAPAASTTATPAQPDPTNPHPGNPHPGNPTEDRG